MVLQVLAVPVLPFEGWFMYFPSWQEIATTILPVAYGVILIRNDAVAVHTHSFLDTSPTFKLSNRAAENATSEEELRQVAEAASR